MKTIGLITGMSWESFIEYCQIINETVKERRGGLHFAKCIMHSVDFAEVEPLQHEGRWVEAAEYRSMLLSLSRPLEPISLCFARTRCTRRLTRSRNRPVLSLQDTGPLEAAGG